MWVKVDDGLPEHRKVFAAASDLGGPHNYARVISMFIQGSCYAARNLTDGFLPIAVVRRFHDSNPAQLARSLVKAALWEHAEGGFQIHDYQEYNPLASTVKEKRARDSARKKRSLEYDIGASDSARNPERTRERDGSSGFLSQGESEGDSPVPGLIKHYHDGYLARFGEKPNILGRKDGALLKGLASTHGVEAVRRRIDAMLDSKDEFIAGSGRTIGVLSTCWNKLGGALRSVGPQGRPAGCRHAPGCVDEAACTKRRLADARGAA